MQTKQNIKRTDEDAKTEPAAGAPDCGELLSAIEKLSDASRETLLAYVLCGFAEEAVEMQSEAVAELSRCQLDEIACWIRASVENPLCSISASDVTRYLADLRERDRKMGAESECSCGGSFVVGKYYLKPNAPK